MNLQALDIGILGPPFVAGLLVLSTHVPLGQQVLARGIIFIDLAVAQIAGLGVIAAYGFHWESTGWEVQLAAGGAALLGALILFFTERRWPEVQEAVIGTAFILAATAGIMLLTATPHGGEHLQDLLAGQILWVGWSDLLPLLILSSVLLMIWFTIGRRASSLWFYVLFAVAVTASVQYVGVFLVFATLIIPALAVRRFDSGTGLIAGYLVGVLGYALGLILSALLDLPSGAVIVWALAIVASSSTLFRARSTTVTRSNTRADM